MKQYKRIVLVAMAFVLLFSLSGCIMIPVTKHYNIPADEVKSICFYDLHGEDGVSYSKLDERYEPVYTLPQKEHKAFLKDFSKIKYSRTLIITIAAVDPGFSIGDWVIRVDFTNGQYSFYSYAGYGETYDAEGTTVSSNHFGCDEQQFKGLIQNYCQA